MRRASSAAAAGLLPEGRQPVAALWFARRHRAASCPPSQPAVGLLRAASHGWAPRPAPSGPRALPASEPPGAPNPHSASVDSGVTSRASPHVNASLQETPDSSCLDMKHLILTERSAFSKPSNIRMTCKRKIDVDLQSASLSSDIKTCMPLNSSVLPQSMMANAARCTPSLNACKRNTMHATLL